MLTCARVGCGAGFVSTAHGVTTKKFCSSNCRQGAHRRTEVGRATEKRYQQSDVNKAKLARHWRTDTYKKTKARWHRSDTAKASRGRYWQSDIGKAKRRAIGHRYRAQKSGAFVETVDVRVLVEQQHNRCSFCGEAFVDVRRDPMSVSLDHTIPLSRGGEHSYANCTAMHLRCNISKGAKVA